MIQLLVLVLVMGIVWYFLSPYVAEPFKTILVVLAILIFCLYLLGWAGLINVPSFR